MFFYVSAIHGKKAVAVLGPYPTKEEAEGNVDRGRKLASEYDSTGRADFAAYGTCSTQKEIKSAFGR